MSEYQYYEFQAIDRPLSQEQMRELRAISSRAEITPTRFTNEYSYGDFRGDPVELLERYFDAHLYLANWGSHILMFAMPSAAVDVPTLQAYQAEGGLAVLERHGRVILTFESQDQDGGGGWVEDDEGAGWMGSLIVLRSEILSGDLRALYLGWLRGVQAEGLFVEDGEDDDDEDEDEDDAWVEPPVPAGLANLTGPLESLVRFLELDQDLVAVAAESSTPLTATGPSLEDVKAWIARLPVDEKDELLVRLLRGESQLQAQLLRRFRQETASPVAASTSTRRTAEELLKAAAVRTEERKRRETEAAAKERNAYLDSVSARQDELWRQADDLADQKKAREYDAAVTILKDLHDVAIRDDRRDAFAQRLAELRSRHARKPALIERLDKARLR